MPQHMFQDPAGTIPAILPGQPVGLVIRQAGLQDATQATALSKPTLARHPKGGVKLVQSRNIWDAAPLGVLTSAYSNNAFLIRQGTDGITTEILERGRDTDGLPYLIVKYSGQNNHASNIQFLNIINDNVVPIPNDKSRIYVSCLATLLDGNLGNSSDVPSLQPYVNFRDASNVTITGNSSHLILTPGVERVVSASSSFPAGAVSVINRGLYVRVPVGAIVNATLKIKALWSSFDPAPPFQVIASPNDITEAGVPDQWHLYNDGGDSLNAVYPAGTYGRVTVGIDRVPVFDTFVSDGTTPVNTLRHERQIYHNARLGAFSETEISALRKWIQEKL